MKIYYETIVLSTCSFMYIHIDMCVCVCVCVCMIHVKLLRMVTLGVRIEMGKGEISSFTL